MPSGRIFFTVDGAWRETIPDELISFFFFFLNGQNFFLISLHSTLIQDCQLLFLNFEAFSP